MNPLFLGWVTDCDFDSKKYTYLLMNLLWQIQYTQQKYAFDFSRFYNILKSDY